MKTSNKFTFSRLVFAPVFFLIYNIPLWTGNDLLAKISAFIMIPLLAVFELTDYFDGHYARKNGEVSDFGKLFDPFADVMLNLTVFACSLKSFDSSMDSYIPLLIFVFIMYREFSQSFLRMVATRQGIAIAARKGGKIKTVFYIISGFAFLAVESAIRLGILDFSAYYSIVRYVLTGFFIVCLLLSYISFIDYLKNFSSVFKNA